MFPYLKKNYLAFIIIFFGLIGFFASFTLTLDKIEIIKRPDYIPACAINTVFNCGTVMRTKYAEIFGFPNSLMGISGYSLAVITGIFLTQVRKYSKAVTWITFIPTLLGFLISYYWLYLSSQVIGVFCPWCLLSTASSTFIFFAVVTINLQENNFGLKPELAKYFNKKITGGWHFPILILWVVAAIIFAAWPFVI
jgi:uncharacterized membrane protein